MLQALVKKLCQVHSLRPRLLAGGMIKYILVALSAILVIGGFTFFGRTARSHIAGSVLDVSSKQDSSQLNPAEGVMDHPSASLCPENKIVRFRCVFEISVLCRCPAWSALSPA